MRKRRTRLAMLFLLISFFPLLGFDWAWAVEKTKMNFALSWVIYGAFTPWFVAKDKGFYTQEGLEVDLSRGYGAAQEVKDLLAEKQNLVFIDPAAVVMARAKGSPVKLVAAIYEKAPMAVVSLKKIGINTLKDLEGKTVGGAPGGINAILFPILARLNQLDPARVKVVSLDPAQTRTMLIAGKVDAVQIYSIDVPAMEEQAAALGGVNILLYADYGLDLYSNSVVATDDYLKTNGDQVKRFIRASIKGFEYSRANPDEAVSSFLKFSPASQREVSRKILDATLKLVFTPAAQKNGVGYMTAEKITKTSDLVVTGYNIKEQVKTEEIYTNDFLK